MEKPEVAGHEYVGKCQERGEITVKKTQSVYVLGTASMKVRGKHWVTGFEIFRA